MSKKTITPGVPVPTLVKFGDLLIGDYFVNSAAVGHGVWFKIDESNAVHLATAWALSYEEDEQVTEVDIVLVWYPVKGGSSQ